MNTQERTHIMFGLGTQELLIILAIVLVLFGGTKLPELSRSVGESIREIRKGLNGPVPEPKKEKKKS